MATGLNIIGLSVAFAAFMVIMMQVNYDLSFNKSIENTDRIYRLEAQFEGKRYALASWQFFDELIKVSPNIEASTLTQMAMDYNFTVELNGMKHSYSEKKMLALPDYPDFFHFQMTEGTSDALNDPEKVLMPESIARKIFGNELAVGKRIGTENHSFTIGGVYKDFPKNSSIPNIIIQQINKTNSNTGPGLSFPAYIKLDKPESAQGLLENVIPQMDKSQMEVLFQSEIQFYLAPFKNIHYDTEVEFDATEKMSKQTIWALFAIAFVILVIAAINFTNFNMALTPLRIKSINTQKVLGASDGSLRGSLLAEAVVLCFLSWILAVGLVSLLSQTGISSLLDADMALAANGPLLGVSLAISLLLGVFAGLYPSWYITSFTPALVLKGSFGLSPQGRTLRNSLMGVQFVASFVLIVAALFMYLQNYYMQTKSVGYDRDQIIITDMDNVLNEKKDAFVNELTAQAGITDVSFARELISGNDNYAVSIRDFRDKDLTFQQIEVDANFLKMMDIEVFEGNDFTKSNQSDTTQRQYLIFNRRAKEEYALTVGDRLKDKMNSEESDVVLGFIPDVNVASMRREIMPMAFSVIKDNSWPWRGWAYIKVKAGSDMYAAMDHVKASLQKLSPDNQFKVRFFSDVISNQYSKERSLTSLITWFSLIAVLISMVGVFGLVVFESEYKRKEIGVRKVLGSTTAEILAMFNKRYVKILGICFVVAAPIAWYTIHMWLQNFAYKTPMYWWVFALSFLVVTMITTATVTFQSWQVANANPVESIKTE